MSISVQDQSERKYFTFDYIMEGDQKEVFKLIGEDIVKEALHGFNIAVFAYGQTGIIARLIPYKRDWEDVHYVGTRERRSAAEGDV